jgi:hypothetical protein
MPPTWFAGNRLTPEPDGDRDRTGIVRIDERVRPHVLLGWARQNKRAVFEAMKNKGMKHSLHWIALTNAHRSGYPERLLPSFAPRTNRSAAAQARRS